MQQRMRSINIAKLLTLGCMVALTAWLIATGLETSRTLETGNIAQVPAQNESQLGGPIDTSPLMPLAEPTSLAPIASYPPTQPPEATPVPDTLQPATLVNPDVVTNASTDPSVSNLTEQATGNTQEPIVSMTWAPTGDGLVYVTVSGNLYWSKPDGSNATLLHTYDPNTTWDLLQDQMPKGDTLLLPGFALKFAPGKVPQLISAPDTLGVYQIRWWSSSRASGVSGGPLSGGSVGSEKLVTLDANGNKIEERNIPYMLSPAVRPGGVWLAYVTDQQSGATPFYGSEPKTAYLMNLQTGERKQLTQPGKAYWIYNWSPNGNWLMMDANVNGGLEGVLVSADGREWFVLNNGHGLHTAVWRPDSNRIALSILDGGQEDPNDSAEPISSSVYLVDVPQRKISDPYDGNGLFDNALPVMVQPRWSPDGSQLAFLSVDTTLAPCAQTPCSPSKISPAIYMMSQH